MTHSQSQILIFARFPVPGKVKTRLIPELGALRAARLYRRMAENALRVARCLHEDDITDNIEISICFTGADKRYFRSWLGEGIHYEPQTSGDLGTRMHQAFMSAFREKSEYAILFGSDAPDISKDILLQAFEKLRDHDIVLGPARDGGYYLIGMKRPHPELFTGIEWGTGEVYQQTLGKIGKMELSFAKTATLDDIDRPRDLVPLRNDKRFGDVLATQQVISVIIPTLNEAETIGHTLELLHAEENVETIVVDGGSRDATVRIASSSGVNVLKITGGRAAQMNAGAAVAQGSVLLFLHADTIPPEGYAAIIRQAMQNPATVAGAFRFRTDSPGRVIRMVEWGANFRSRFFQWPYGDQGLFMEKRIFDEIGGFPPMSVMEDFELVRRLRRRGRITTVSEAAITSGRRWQRLGIVRTTFFNQLMIAGYILGVPIERLALLYRNDFTKKRRT